MFIYTYTESEMTPNSEVVQMFLLSYMHKVHMYMIIKCNPSHNKNQNFRHIFTPECGNFVDMTYEPKSMFYKYNTGTE